jgi:hypothetical protein
MKIFKKLKIGHILKWICISSILLSIPIDFSAQAFEIRTEAIQNASKKEVDTIVTLLRLNIKTELDKKYSQREKSRSDFEVSLSIVKLGNTFRIFSEKKLNSKKIFSAQVSEKAEADLDKALLRLAKMLVSENSSDKKSLLDENGEFQSQVSSNRVRGSFEFGPHFAFGLGTNNLLLHWNLGLHWENPNFRMGLFFDRSSSLISEGNDQNISIYHLGVSAEYIFNQETFSPYIGTEFAFGETNGYQIDAVGFSTALRAGYLLFRTSPMQINLSLFFRPVLQKVANKYAGTVGFSLGAEF